MGFEELSEDDLTRWLSGWVSDVAAVARVETQAGVDAGRVTVSVQGELTRVELTAAAMQLGPEQLGHGIERAYGQAYLAAVQDVEKILHRITEDVEENPALVSRINQLRAKYVDLHGLKEILRRRRGQHDPEWDDPSEWDPSADPLKRGIPRRF
jgi:hypothetical protein